MRRRPGKPLFIFDPGFLFVISGAALVAAIVLLPAIDDRDVARHYRDKALSLEAYRASTLARQARYLDALHAGDPTVLASLDMTQRGVVPADRALLIRSAPVAGANILDALVGFYAPPAAYAPPDSLLHRFATDPSTRLWLMAGAVMCVLYGLMPPAGMRGPSEATADTAPEGRRRVAEGV